MDVGPDEVVSTDIKVALEINVGKGVRLAKEEAVGAPNLSRDYPQ